MKKISIACNICTESSQDLDCKTYGISFEDGIQSISIPVDVCDTHICELCLKELFNAAKKEGVLP